MFSDILIYMGFYLLGVAASFAITMLHNITVMNFCEHQEFSIAFISFRHTFLLSIFSWVGAIIGMVFLLALIVFLTFTKVNEFASNFLSQETETEWENFIKKASVRK